MSDTDLKPLAWSLNPADWTAWCATAELPAFRARQIWHGLYRRQATAWDALTILPAAVRSLLSEAFDLAAMQESAVRASPDGVRKLLLTCRDGQQLETVLIPADDRHTVCVSSQIGCAFGCAFCASGQAGWVRDLAAGEIVGQVLAAIRQIAPSGRLTNLVIMGMGEPLANYEAVLAAIRTCNDGEGLGIGARRITLSTCGVVPGIRRLAEEGLQVELSVSLHAPNDELRARLMPVNRRWPLDELLRACDDYTEHTGRIITFEYTLVAGVNDAPEHARELIARLRGRRCRVNLIPLSPVDGFHGRAPAGRICEAFAAALEQARINTTLRRSRGGAVDAACGQLRRRQAAASAATSSGVCS